MVETSDTVTLLDALFEAGRGAEYNVWWNVSYDFGAIVKPWVVAQAPTLKANHLSAIRLKKTVELLLAQRFTEGKLSGADSRAKTAALKKLATLESVERFDIGGKYHVLYIPKKGFRITRTQRKRGRNSVTFFDAATFYAVGIGSGAKLDTVARERLGRGKSDEERGIDVAALGSVEGYYEAHRDAIREYCLDDCRLTAELFAHTIRGFEAIGFTFPREPWSRASVGREILKRGSERHGIPAGTLEATREGYRDLNVSAAKRYWEKAFAGGCIVTRAAGTWTGVSKWDLNSAYPWPMDRFPSLDGAYVVGRDSPEFDGCFFKFFEIDVTPTPRHALRPPDEPNLVYHSGGEPRRCFVTQLDLDAFDLWHDPYEIVDAIGIVTPSADRPLDFMPRLYDVKNQVKKEYGEDSVEYLNAKIPLNGIYGILTQSKPREGRYTNYIYGAYITAWTRREVWRQWHAVEAHGGTVLAALTDGLLVSDLPTLPPRSDVLGAWDVEDVGTATLFANGLYIVKGKLKKRGAPDLRIEDLMAARQPWVTTEHTRPLGLKQGIIRGVPEAIGCFSFVVEGEDICRDRKDLCPARMLEEAGLRMDPVLRAAPLKDYFTERWLLDYRASDERKLPPRVLTVTAEE
ncbi:MAG: hypothetical protein WBF81_06025 [Thermoplasmata archaeon]